jgi:hypothetical protein
MSIHIEGVEGNKSDNCPFLCVGPVHGIGNIGWTIPVNEIEAFLMFLFYSNFVIEWRYENLALVRNGSLSHDSLDLSLEIS